MGAPSDRRIWIRKEIDAVYIGKWADPFGAEALFFLDPATRRAIGPLNLQLTREDPGSVIVAPSVGAAPSATMGDRGSA